MPSDCSVKNINKKVRSLINLQFTFSNEPLGKDPSSSNHFFTDSILLKTWIISVSSPYLLRLFFLFTFLHAIVISQEITIHRRFLDESWLLSCSMIYWFIDTALDDPHTRNSTVSVLLFPQPTSWIVFRWLIFYYHR